MINFDLDNSIIYLTLFTTHIKPAISSSIGQLFFFTEVRSMERKRIGSMVLVDDQRSSEIVLLEVV